MTSLPEIDDSCSPLIISTSMYCDGEAEATDFPSAGSNSASQDFQKIYWRCVCVFFASARYFCKEASLLLFTNIDRLPDIDGFDLARFLEGLNVKTITLERKYILPAGFTSSFGNCFFKLDCIRYFCENSELSDSSILLLDNDIVITSPLGELSLLIREKGYVFYDVNHVEYNGFTLKEISALFVSETGAVNSVPTSTLGGEFVGFHSRNAIELGKAVSSVFRMTIRRFEASLPRLTTEEHVYAYSHLLLNFHVLPCDGNPYIRRIWTGRYNNQLAGDSNVAMWHLPREKRYGFARLFAMISKATPTEEVFSKSSLGAIFGIPSPSIRKIFLDYIGYLNIKIKDWLKV